MSTNRVAASVLIGLVWTAFACGGGETPKAAATTAEPIKAASQIDVCSLLTAAEIAEVTGSKATEIKPDTHGAVGTCNYQAGNSCFRS